MAKLRLIIVALVSVFILWPSAVVAADWRLTEVRGAVRVAAPARPVVPGVAGQMLSVGTSVTTGGDGRAVLTNGDQRIVVSPNSRTTLAPEAGGFTRILQDLGSALFQVDRRRQSHFRVETPLLAAVVKGTTFTVSIDPMGDQVHVAEGLVEVRANSGNAFGDVAAGATALVSRSQPGSLEISAPSAAVTIDVAALTLAPIDYSEVSGGLVENPSDSGVRATSGDRAPVTGSPSASSGHDGLQGGLGGLLETTAGAGGNGNIGRGDIGKGDGGSVGGNPGDGGNPGNGGGNPGGDPGNGNGGGNPGGNPGNGNGGGNPGGDPGNGNGGGNPGGNPGNGNGGGSPGGNPGNGSGGGSPGGNPGNGSGGGTPGGNPGNGNGGGNPGGAPGNGNGGGNPGGDPGNGNGGGNPGGAPGNGNGGGNPGGQPGAGTPGGKPGNGGGGPGRGGR